MSPPNWFFVERVLTAMTFALSAGAKARNLDAFHHTLRGLGLAGDRAARRLAPAVVAAEAIVVVGMVAPVTAVGSSVLALGLLAVFAVVLATARARGSTVGCNCFGSSPQPVSWYDVARAVLLMLAIGGGLLSGGPPDPPGPVAAAQVVLGCAATVLVLVNLRAIGETLRRPLTEESSP